MGYRLPKLHIGSNVQEAKNQKRRKCKTGKVAYKTVTSAKNAAIRLFNANKTDGKVLYHYNCPHCNKIHLTNNKQR